MKRVASTSLENLESLNQEDISHKQVEDLRCFISSNRARDYFLLKARMSNEAFTNALRSLFFDGTGGEPQVKTDNPFYQAMYSVAGSACSYGVNHSYAFQMMDHSDGSTQPEATALEPFVFTLVQLPNNQFRVMINRVNDQLEIAVGNLLDIYRTYDIRTINSSRIISDIEMQHGIAADHSIYQDILSTIENTVSLQCAHTVLCKVSYDALCQALGVARTSFVKFILDFLQRLNIKPHDFIEKDRFLLLITIIIGGSFNDFHHPVEPTQKLELLFSHIGTRPYMQSNFITEFLHPYINKALEKSNIDAVTFLLAKVTSADKRKLLFEKSNYELFFTAYKCRNIPMMAILASLLPENLQQKFFALIYLLTYRKIQLQAACWAASRDKLLKWVEELLEKTNDEKIKVRYRELQKIILDRKAKYTMQDPTTYQYSDREYELHPPVCTNSEDNYDQTLQPLPVTQEQQDEMSRWINEVLPELLNRFQDYTVEQWKSNISELFIISEAIAQYPKANYLSFKFMPITDFFYQKLLLEHLQITEKEQPNFAIQQFFSRGEFKAPLWSHQLDVQHCSKLEAKTVRVMGTLWHAEVLKTLQPLYNSNRQLRIDTNFALIKMTFIVTTKEGLRTKVEVPIALEGACYVHCTSFDKQKEIYTLYKSHGKKILGDNHSDDANFEGKNIPHSEKTFVYYIHQDVMINAIAQKLNAFKKLHAIILDIISTNQCCKTCQLMLIGLQNSHNINDGFLSRLTNALTVRNVTIPRNGKIIRMITRYSSFQPMNTNATNVSGNTPDLIPKYQNYFRKNTILHSNTHLEPALPAYRIGTTEHLKQHSIDEHRSRANTAASIQADDDIIHEEYQPKHDVQYCGTQSLSLKQLCGNDKKNRVILCAPQKSTELYLKKPPSVSLELRKFTLFCSGNIKVTAIEEKWHEMRGPDQNDL